MKMFLSLVFIAILTVIFVAASGTYNISATEKHWKITETAIAWVRERSINAQAKNLTVPQLDEQEVLSSGLEHYQAMCPECHLSPGQKETEISMGLSPQAPIFHERSVVTDESQRSEIMKKYFWAIKNGIKMSGMSAWGLSHDDKSIWAMSALALKLHGMSAQEYQEHLSVLAANHSHGHDHGHSHDDHGDHSH